MVKGLTALACLVLLCATRARTAQPPTPSPYESREFHATVPEEHPPVLFDMPHGVRGTPGCGDAVGACPPSGALWPPAKQPFIFIDYLNWKPTRQGLDYAIVDPLTAAAVSGDIAQVSLDRESGVRTGLGFSFASGWDVCFTYTNLHSRGDDQVTGVIRATASHPAFNIDAAQAAANASLEYDVFDLELGRSFMVDETLRLRVSGGVRGARMQEAFQIAYQGGDFTNGLVVDSTDFDALGLRIAAEAQWDICYGWGLFGRAGTSLLTGQFETRLLEADAVGLIVDVRDNAKRAVPVLDLAFGFSWQGCHWKLESGYDFTNWFNMLGRPVFHDDLHVGSFSRRQGNLGLDGFFVRLAHVW